MDITWADEAPSSITVRSTQGKRCRLHYGGAIAFDTRAGHTYVIDRIRDGGLENARVRKKGGGRVPRETE